MGCGSIGRSEVNNCATPIVGGIGGGSRLVVYNYDEVSFTESGTTPNLFTAITLTSGASGYQFQGYKLSLKPSVDVVAGASGQSLFKHSTAFVIFSNTQLTKNNIQNLAQGRYVVLYENNGKNTESFELMGVNVGLELKPQKIRDLQVDGAAYTLLLQTPDAELETKLPQTFLSSTYAATLTAVNTTLFLPTVTNISDLTLTAAGGDAETITGTNFYGSIGLASEVASVQWENQVTKALTTQTGVTVASNTSITFTSVALVAGTYKLIVTTTKGVASSTQIAVAA